MRADYLRRCTYVISKLKVMQQTLQTTVADEGTPHHREESCRTLEGSSVTPTHALGDRREEEDDAPAPVMNPKEHDHGSLSYDPIRCHRPLRTADTVSGPWETGEATLGGPQAAAVGTVSPETSGPRGAQEARHERREEASEIEIGPPGRVAVIQEEGIGTDGRVRDHRQDVMARVKALRAEQRSMRDIPAIPNAEGVATFTGQG